MFNYLKNASLKTMLFPSNLAPVDTMHREIRSLQHVQVARKNIASVGSAVKNKYFILVLVVRVWVMRLRTIIFKLVNEFK